MYLYIPHVVVHRSSLLSLPASIILSSSYISFSDTSQKLKYVFPVVLGFSPFSRCSLLLPTAACWFPCLIKKKSMTFSVLSLPPSGGCRDFQLACPIVFLSKSNKMVLKLSSEFIVKCSHQRDKESTKGNLDNLMIGRWRQLSGACWVARLALMCNHQANRRPCLFQKPECWHLREDDTWCCPLNSPLIYREGERLESRILVGVQQACGSKGCFWVRVLITQGKGTSRRVQHSQAFRWDWFSLIGEGLYSPGVGPGQLSVFIYGFLAGSQS